MSLDIKVKRKNVPPVVRVETSPVKPPPVKPPVQNRIIEKSSKSLPPKPAMKDKKYGYGWWILFIILVLLFGGVIYVIWNEQSKPAEEVSIKKDKSAGIVSTFVPENQSPENNVVPTEVGLFSLDTVKVATSDFTDKLFLYKQGVQATSTKNIKMSSNDVYQLAQLTYDTLQEQYNLLQQSIDQASTTSTMDIFTSEIDNYLQRVEGEFNILATLVDLESETSFSPEIEVSLEKLDKYFQEIKNLIQVISQNLYPDFEVTTGNNISTTTIVSTTTDIQATTTIQ